MKLTRWAILSGLLILVAAATATSADNNAWGTVKGQVVWAEKDMPERPPINVTTNQKECLKNGPLLAETYLVDKSTKGVRYVTVWLIPADGSWPITIPAAAAFESTSVRATANPSACNCDAAES